MAKQHAPQYYPPQKRKEMKDYLTKTSIKFTQQPMPNDIKTNMMCIILYLYGCRLQRDAVHHQSSSDFEESETTAEDSWKSGH